MLRKILIGLLTIILIAIVSAAGWLAYMGFFAPVKIKEKDMGPLTIVYMRHTGDYSKVTYDMEKVYSRLGKEFNIKPQKGVGIYYDDPSKVKTENLRSDVGYLLEGPYAAKANVIMKKMKVKIVFMKKYYTTEFPIKNNLSFIIGIIKVYPELAKYMTAHGYKPTPSIEIYDISGKKIVFAFEIKK